MSTIFAVAPMAMTNIAVCIAIMLLPSVLSSQIITLDTAKSEQYTLGQEITFLEDTNGTWTLDSVRSQRHSNRFRQIRSAYPNFSYTSSAYWLRYTVVVQSSPILGSWLVAAYYPSVDNCDVYIFSHLEGRVISQIRCGARIPWEQKIIPHRYHLAPLPRVLASDTLTVFMRVQSRMTLAVPLDIITQRQFSENERTELIPAWMYYGIALAMAVYNLFLFITLRDRAYFFYVLYVVFYGAFIFVSVNALVFQFFPTYAWLVPTLVTTLSLSGNIFGLLFGKEFLHLREFGTWSVRLGWGLIGVCMLGLCVQWFVPIPLMHRLLNLVALCVLVFMLANAALTLRRGFRPALFFLLAWTMFFIGAVVFILSNLAFLPKTPLVQSSLQLGSALEMVLLSLALADRIAVLRKERERAHAEALQGEIYRLRTIELSEANTEIERQKEILEEQARDIEMVNTTLHEQNERLLVLDKEKNEFLGIAAHDLKNPLSAIRGLTEVMLMDGERMPASDRTVFMRQILLTSERMIELVRNLLDINVIEQGGMTLSPIRHNLTTMVGETLTDYAAHAEAKGLQIIFQPTASEQVFVQVDGKALRQVLDNLVSNAIKYSPQGKQVFVRIINNAVQNVVSNKKNDMVLMQSVPMLYARLEVQDEGEGISSEDMKLLFGKFTRLSARPTAGEHSTGLGLSIVKKLVEAMNGRVWCESELGKGATFFVELPM
jgi:two-component system, sensor histidine kinase LadS